MQTDDALTYALTGEAATSNAFTIDSATGQISVKQGATIDYEAKSSYTGQVTWTVQEQEAYADVVIQVTDAEAGKPDAPTVTRTRFDEPTHPALDVAWIAPNANGTTINGYEVQYREKVADGQTPNAWTTYRYTDADENVTSKLSASTLSLTLPYLKYGAIYEFQVRAVTSLEGPGPWSDTGSARANLAPSGRRLALSPRTYAINTVATAYLDRYYYDSDGDTLTWIVSSQYPGLVGLRADPVHVLPDHALPQSRHVHVDLRGARRVWRVYLAHRETHDRPEERDPECRRELRRRHGGRRPGGGQQLLRPNRNIQLHADGRSGDFRRLCH